MNEEREKVYQILELGKHEKNLHHKKGFGGLLFIDLSMIKFSKLSSYIRQLDKENQELKKQLHEASLTIQEMTEQDIECPSNCEKLRQLKKQVEENTETLLGRILELRGQQKEFIKYMNSCIKELEKGSHNKLQNTINLGIINITKTILQKYKSIIGDDK